jgi:hypothetical protein
MILAPLKQYFRGGALFRRVMEVVDFCTYREVREFDFRFAETPRSSKPTARKS